jgi:hypothetical protein
MSRCAIFHLPEFWKMENGDRNDKRSDFRELWRALLDSNQ